MNCLSILLHFLVDLQSLLSWQECYSSSQLAADVAECRSRGWSGKRQWQHLSCCPKRLMTEIGGCHHQLVFSYSPVPGEQTGKKLSQLLQANLNMAMHVLRPHAATLLCSYTETYFFKKQKEWVTLR